jgi:hypothetical protein
MSQGPCCCVHVGAPNQSPTAAAAAAAAALAAYTPQNHPGAPPLVAAGTSAAAWAHLQSSTAVGRWWTCCSWPGAQRSPRCLHRDSTMHASPVSHPCQRRLWLIALLNVLGLSSSAAAAATALRGPANGLYLRRVVNVHRVEQPVLAFAPAAWRCAASMMRRNKCDSASWC